MILDSKDLPNGCNPVEFRKQPVKNTKSFETETPYASIISHVMESFKAAK